MTGLYGWMNRNLRGKKGQGGFTLIELLVVVTILGILAAIVTLSLVGLTTNANLQSCRSEYKTVQAALDAFMAANNVDQINASISNSAPAPTNDMQQPLLPVASPIQADGATGTLALFNPAPTGSQPNFTRNGKTQFSYTWDANGKITVISNGPNGCNNVS
ncbi:MAG TPA: prepilin-type N-terminal cleavage/methylation domain-containing protein [Candidatus Dormibacteraeota bacterium]|nr:prepilin-type N-terminal cleavage/methylation domain-containing protein [Candidatus Dormibacteraeota bacterium]